MPLQVITVFHFFILQASRPEVPSGFSCKSGDQLSNSVRKKLHERCRTLFGRVVAFMTTHISTLLLIVALSLPSPTVAHSLGSDSSFQNPPPPQIQGLATGIQKVLGKEFESESKLPDALLSDADDSSPPLSLFSAKALANSFLFSLQGRIPTCPRAPPVFSVFSTVKFLVC